MDFVCGDYYFIDGGTAFVDALEKRQSSFGTLHIMTFRPLKNPFSAENLRRLFNLEVFDFVADKEMLLPLQRRHRWNTPLTKIFDPEISTRLTL